MSSRRDWVVLDAELMPWSAKAQELIRQQYAPVGVAAQVSLAAVVDALKTAAARGVATSALGCPHAGPARSWPALYVDAYRRYTWPVASLADLKLAPFHLLASDGHVHGDRDHVWHMETLARICRRTRRQPMAACSSPRPTAWST